MNVTEFNQLVQNIMSIQYVSNRQLQTLINCKISRNNLSNLLPYLESSFIEDCNNINEYNYEILYNYFIDLYNKFMESQKICKLQFDIKQYISYNDDNFYKLHWFQNEIKSFKILQDIINEVIVIINKLYTCIEQISNKLNISINVNKFVIENIKPIDMEVINKSKKVKDCLSDGFIHTYLPRMETDKYIEETQKTLNNYTFNLI